MVVGHHAAGEEIDAKRSGLIAQLEPVKGAGIVVPAKVTHEALIAVGELLAADFERKGNSL
jgi:hypothetical protein